MSYLARRYAQALFESHCPEEPFSQGVQLIMENPPLWDALRSPLIPQAEKEAVLQSLSPFSETPTLLRFFHLLMESRRIGLLTDIAEEFRFICLEANEVSECTVTCVHIPEEALQKRLQKTLCEIHNKPEVQLLFHIDPALIGGFILHMDGVTYDQSIRGRLLGLSHYLEEVNAL